VTYLEIKSSREHNPWSASLNYWEVVYSLYW